MAEPLQPLASGMRPPPLPPRVRTAPPALPPRPQSASSLQSKKVISYVEMSVTSVNSSNSGSTGSEVCAIKKSSTFDTVSPLHRAATASAILPTVDTPAISPSGTQSSQGNPRLPSLILSFILREPLERSHGRLSTITAVQSFFQSNLPTPPPFEYSTLVDHALLASQIALHDPHMRQQKRLPLVLSLSIGAFLVAATGIVPRYFGWPILAAATWFGPARFLMKEMWYIAVGLIALAFVVDIFPILSFCTLFWVSVICVSRGVDAARNGGNRQEQNVPRLIHNTARTLQNGGDTKRVALDMVQNVTEWWRYRQSEPERIRRIGEKAAKKAQEEGKKLEKLRRVETIKEKKRAEIDQKEAERLRKLEQEEALKQMKAERKAEKQRIKEEEITRKCIEKELIELEKQRKKEEEEALEKTKSAEKELAKEMKRKEELELKRHKTMEREERKQEKERRKREKESDSLRSTEENGLGGLKSSSGTTPVEDNPTSSERGMSPELDSYSLSDLSLKESAESTLGSDSVLEKTVTQI